MSVPRRVLGGGLLSWLPDTHLPNWFHSQILECTGEGEEATCTLAIDSLPPLHTEFGIVLHNT